MSSRIETDPSEVPIDKASLTSFVNSNRVIKSLDQVIAKLMGASLTPAVDRTIESDLEGLNFFKIGTIADLEKSLEENNQAIERFAEAWLDGVTELDIIEGISLFYLQYVVMAKQKDPDIVLEWVDAFNIDVSDEQTDLFDRIMRTGEAIGL